jgi:hypothetical protein
MNKNEDATIDFLNFTLVNMCFHTVYRLLATPKNVTFPQFTDIIFVASGSSGMV